MEPSVGIEPTLSSLPTTCFTTKLRRPKGQLAVKRPYYSPGTTPYRSGRIGRQDKRVRPTDFLVLPLLSRIDAKGSPLSRSLRTRKQIYRLRFRTVNAKVVDFAAVIS